MSKGIDMQCTAESGLSSLKGRWWNGWLFFDPSGHHHGNLPWRGELASPRLAYLTLPIPSPLICFWGLRNALSPFQGKVIIGCASYTPQWQARTSRVTMQEGSPSMACLLSDLFAQVVSPRRYDALPPSYRDEEHALFVQQQDLVKLARVYKSPRDYHRDSYHPRNAEYLPPDL